MKILDRYILTTYLRTFISVFVILMLIFVLQTIWLYIKELAGKDLDIIVIAKFLLYFSPKLIPLVLPLTILLSSIMVFGNFAENYEFAAMKSTGISLQRAMAGLSIFIIALGITTFFFSNNVIPWGEYNSYNLRKNIAKLKPAMIIAEGQFNDLGSINIKVANKSGDRGQYLEEIVIHEKTGRGLGNFRAITAKTGELFGEEKSDILKLILFDGHFFDDTPPKDFNERDRHPASKGSFKKYTFIVDLSKHSIDLDEKNITDTYKMLNVAGLNYTIDSLQNAGSADFKDFSSSLYNRTQIAQLNGGLKPNKDSIYEGPILELFDTKKKVQLLELALNTVTSTKQIIRAKDPFIKIRYVIINRHIIALNEKFALGFACIILFFVGAPLGALIRKGGIGLPMVIAILLFLTYHFIGIFAINSAKDGTINPTFAAWFSTIIMFPLGVFLTKRATADRGLFEFDHILEPLKNIFRRKDKKHLVQNHPQTSVILNVQEQKNFKLAYNDYTFNSKSTLVLYCIAIILFVLFFVLNNNKLESFASASIQLSLISTVLILVYYIKSIINLKMLYTYKKEKSNLNNLFAIILGLFFYPLTHFLRKNKIAEDFTISSK